MSRSFVTFTWEPAYVEFRFSQTDAHSTFTTIRGSVIIKMWILLVIWIIFFGDERVINECRLVLHALAAAVCQLYLALLPLRHAAQHFKAACHLTYQHVNDPDKRLSDYSTEEWLRYLLRKATVHFLEGVCLLWESLSQLLAVVSTLCVAVRHVLQGALFLIVSTARWAQQRLLFKGEVDEWMKEQKQQRERLQKERRHAEEYLLGDSFTGKKTRFGGLTIP